MKIPEYKGWVKGDCDYCGSKNVKGRYYNSIAEGRMMFRCFDCMNKRRIVS
jgi:hypothetical protein